MKRAQIEEKLRVFAPVFMVVEDESQNHRLGLETHFKVVLVSPQFVDLKSIQRHQSVYQALGDFMNEIHALTLHTYSPVEWSEVGNLPQSPRCRGGHQ